MRVTEKDELLGETPQLKERLDKRNLYLDPLNASQVILLGRTRKAEAEDNAEELELWTEPLLRTISRPSRRACATLAERGRARAAACARRAGESGHVKGAAYRTAEARRRSCR